jgi:hypothetical protein
MLPPPPGPQNTTKKNEYPISIAGNVSNYGPGIESTCGEIFRTYPGDHPASCAIYTGYPSRE